MTKKLQLAIDDNQLWQDFKATVTKDITLNEAIVNLIKEKIEASNNSDASSSR